MGVGLVIVGTMNFLLRRVYGSYAARQTGVGNETRWSRANLPLSVFCWAGGIVLIVVGIA